MNDKAFEEWMVAICGDQHPIKDSGGYRLAEAAWAAATLAERERCAEVARGQDFRHADCEGCRTARTIATEIEKGEQP